MLKLLILIFNINLLASCGVEVPKDLKKPFAGDDSDEIVIPQFDALFEGGDQTCAILQDGQVSITRKSKDNTMHANEVWEKGTLFGSNDSKHPNRGFTSRDRSIINGSPIVPQLQNLGCSPEQEVLVGWRFSNNVNDLTKNLDLDIELVRGRSKDASKTLIQTSGVRRVSYRDPSLIQGSDGFYDESARNGLGQLSLYSVSQIGSADKPNVVKITRNLETEAESLYIAKVYTSKKSPIHEIVLRSLKPSRAILSRKVLSGVYIAEFKNGPVLSTEVKNIFFKRPEADTKPPYPGVCAAISGSLTHRIRNVSADHPGLKIDAFRDFAKGKATEFKCNSGIKQDLCNSLGSEALQKYAPPACLY